MFFDKVLNINILTITSWTMSTRINQHLHRASRDMHSTTQFETKRPFTDNVDFLFLVDVTMKLLYNLKRNYKKKNVL